MKKKLQRPFEVKSMDTATGVFTGYGSVFGEIDSYRDVVLPGAFTKSLAEHEGKGRPIPMLWQHRSAEPIGVYRELKEDEHGLFVRGEINMNVVRGVECAHLMKQGALSGLSIGYNTLDEDYDDKKFVNYLKEIDLWEISPVTFPAGDSARITDIKSLGGLASLADVEDYLRDRFDLSQKEATAMLSQIKAVVLNPSDSGSTKGNAEKVANALKRISFN